VLIKFTELANPNFNKWVSNYKQATALTKLRDTLLPKLISGELSVQKAEQLADKK
jgi:type I restriction enzyme S subunit